MPIGNDSNTVLLIHSHNANGLSRFVDSSVGGNGGNRHTITITGTVTHSTTQKKTNLGDTSIFIANATSYLSIADHQDFYHSSNFTIDFWFFTTVLTGTNLSLINQFVSASSFFSIELSTTTLNVFAKDAGVSLLSVSNLAATGLVVNTWYHVALVRSGNSISLYLNSTLKQTATIITNFPNYAAPLNIGKYSTYNAFVGYLTELRISKVARSDLSPTSPYTAVTDSSANLAFATPAAANIVVASSVDRSALAIPTAIDTPAIASSIARSALAIPTAIDTPAIASSITRSALATPSASHTEIVMPSLSFGSIIIPTTIDTPVIASSMARSALATPMVVNTVAIASSMDRSALAASAITHKTNLNAGLNATTIASPFTSYRDVRHELSQFIPSQYSIQPQYSVSARINQASAWSVPTLYIIPSAISYLTGEGGETEEFFNNTLIEPLLFIVDSEEIESFLYVDVPPQTLPGFIELTDVAATIDRCHNYHARCAMLISGCDLRKYFNLADEVPDSFLNIQIHHACLQLYKDTGIPEKTYPMDKLYEWQDAQRHLALANALPHLNTFTLQGAARAQGLATQLNAVFLTSPEVEARVAVLKRRYTELVKQLRWPPPEVVNPNNNPFQWIAI